MVPRLCGPSRGDPYAVPRGVIPMRGPSWGEPSWGEPSWGDPYAVPRLGGPSVGRSFGVGKVAGGEPQSNGDRVSSCHAFHYSAAHDSPANKKFVDALKKRDPNAIANYASVGAWDGMYVIHKMIEATGGKRTATRRSRRPRALQVGEPARTGARSTRRRATSRRTSTCARSRRRAACSSTRKCRTSGRRSTTGWTSKPARNRHRLRSPAVTAARQHPDRRSGLRHGAVRHRRRPVGHAGTDALRQPRATAPSP